MLYSINGLFRISLQRARKDKMLRKARKHLILLLAFVLVLTSCSFFNKSYQEGVYEGVGYGYQTQTPIRISVAIDSNERVREIIVLDQAENEEIGGKAIESLIRNVLAQDVAIDDLEVDVISHATQSSYGFEQALRDALEKAKNE